MFNLPSTSAFYASRRGGPQYRGWDEDRYALVSMVNALRAQNYMFQLANRDPKKSAKPPEPTPFPTPDDNQIKKKPKPNSFSAIAGSMIAAARKKKEMAYGRSGADYSPGEAGYQGLPEGSAEGPREVP